ncbi:MAG: methyltransferase domain-containing protein [Candidatus Lokiarchaeota archaeon]|nr:methyltransferase domain-containing protein [Candidatus Lokiarchaeota archaeon]
MAVTYMRKLEEEPETYDSNFTTLTKGINIEVHDWVLDHLKEGKTILEVGSGTGILSSKMAKKGRNVVAIDKNFQMINQAMLNYPSNIDGTLLYQIGTFKDLPIPLNSQDVIISTFMLSELRPFEQQIFLRNSWIALKPEGRLIIGAEFVPTGLWKVAFILKRWRYKKKLRRLRLKNTYLVKWFMNYLAPIGFKIVESKKWKHGSIQALELIKVNEDNSNEPGYYKPSSKKFRGIGSQFRIFRCTLTGQADRVPIEPGIYRSGNPTKNSPIIVTANYDFTYIKVMRNLLHIDAWVLCVDSNGINVWCAARGNDFGNEQILEAVEATGIQNYSEETTLILPQLSAGGVSIPQLPKKSENFPFKIKFGPVWSKHIPQYLEEKPTKKPDHMKLAKFSLVHRLRAWVTHTTFLLRKIFLLPIIGFFVIFLLSLPWINKLTWVGELISWIILSNAIISILFPLSNFTRSFIKKGMFFGFFTSLILGGISWLLHGSLIFILLNVILFFWIAFFSTMSFSGYTMATSPREIQEEYSSFKRINKFLLITGTVLSIIGIIFY